VLSLLSSLSTSFRFLFRPRAAGGTAPGWFLGGHGGRDGTGGSVGRLRRLSDRNSTARRDSEHIN